MYEACRAAVVSFRTTQSAYYVSRGGCDQGWVLAAAQGGGWRQRCCLPGAGAGWAACRPTCAPHRARRRPLCCWAARYCWGLA